MNQLSARRTERVPTIAEGTMGTSVSAAAMNAPM